MTVVQKKAIVPVTVAVNSLVGAPFESGARGPLSFDCWGLVLHVLREVYAIEAPDWDLKTEEKLRTRRIIAAEIASERWHKVEALAGGEVVIAAQAGREHHVGIVICGGILHAEQSIGVHFEPIDLFKRRFQKVAFYRWTADPLVERDAVARVVE